MNVEESKIKVDRKRAADLLTMYRQHADQLTKSDEEIARAYGHLARGKVIIRALHAIEQAGLDEQGLPRLAIARADIRKITCTSWNGHLELKSDEPYTRARNGNFSIRMPGSSINTRRARADVPMIPVDVRPQKHLERYHILFEADWHDYPVDPYLLRRIGQADLWLVLAEWELTDLERAVMSHRVNV